MTVEGASIVLLAFTTFGGKVLDYFVGKRHDAKLDHIKRVADATHTLSNSAMDSSLKATASALKAVYLTTKRVATLTSDPVDVAASEAALASWVAAEKLVGRHEAQQFIVDKAVQEEVN